MTILWLETRDSHLHSFGELQNYHVWLAYQDGYPLMQPSQTCQIYFWLKHGCVNSRHNIYHRSLLVSTGIFSSSRVQQTINRQSSYQPLLVVYVAYYRPDRNHPKYCLLHQSGVTRRSVIRSALGFGVDLA